MKDNNKIQSLKTISIRDINIKSEKEREREKVNALEKLIIL